MTRRYVPPLLALWLLAGNAGAQQPPPAQVIDLKAPDGSMLKATYFAAARPGPGVLLLHQCNRQRKVWDDLGRELTGVGINVLTFDLRGFGESDGTRFDKLTPQENAKLQAEKWPGDIDTAFRYLVSQQGVRHDVIGVGGGSCGVNNSIHTARRHPAEVKSLVLLSGGADLAGRQFLRQASHLPALFSVADDDEFPPTVEIMPWLFNISSNASKRYIHYATGGHGADMFSVHPDLRGLIVEWYVTTLIKTPGRAPIDKSGWPALPSAQVLSEIETPGGTGNVERKLAAARRKDPRAVIFPESVVNLMGYDHLQSGDTKGALDIMRLNAAAYPESANVYDSLSDAYLAAGNNEQARHNAKKALERLDTDTTVPEPRRAAIRESAQQKLTQLGKE
jgi:pimeloyl-ACP methyl ester carboxylesterase